MGAKLGNQNATKSKKGRKSAVVRISVDTMDIICDALALEGNVDPSRNDIKNAVAYAVRQIYGRRLENDQAMIL